jgi:hypothetical protein
MGRPDYATRPDAGQAHFPRTRYLEENKASEAGKTPEGWETRPAKDGQKDKDARCMKKNDSLAT